MAYRRLPHVCASYARFAQLHPRIRGELHVDGLEDEVTSSWDAFIENSARYQELLSEGRGWLKSLLLGQRDLQAGQESQEFIDSYAEEIGKLPPSQRERARKSLLHVFERLYDDPDDKKRAIAELVLNAFEKDDYWLLVRQIDETPPGDIHRLAELLLQWGVNEVAGLVERARERLKILDAFENLVGDPSALELTDVHAALQQNVWLLSEESELLTSNRGLRRLVDRAFNARYAGNRGKDRPDLFLAGLQNRYVLVELKKPTNEISYDDVAQAQRYRSEVQSYVPNGSITLIVIGGTIDSNVRHDAYPGVLVTTYYEILQRARTRLQWLIQNLEHEQDSSAD